MERRFNSNTRFKGRLSGNSWPREGAPGTGPHNTHTMFLPHGEARSQTQGGVMNENRIVATALAVAVMWVAFLIIGGATLLYILGSWAGVF